MCISVKELLSPRDYNFHLTASAYNFSWYYDGSKLITILDESKPIIACTHKVDSKLKVRIYARDKVDNISWYMEKLEFILGVNEDLSKFYEICASDPLFHKSCKLLKGFRLRCCSLWDALMIGVCQQNASFKQGWKMLSMLHKLLGKKVEVENWGYSIIPPSPTTIVKASQSELKACGLGYRAEALLSIAKQFISGTLSNDDVMKYKESDLTRVKGIGPYTARLALVLSARKYDLPPIDRWLKRIICEVYKVKENVAEVEWRRRWRRWSGLASVLTTIILDAEPLSKALMRIRKGLTYPLLSDKDMTPLNLWKFI